MEPKNFNSDFITLIQRLINLIIFLVILLIVLPIAIINADTIAELLAPKVIQEPTAVVSSTTPPVKDTFWHAPELASITDATQKAQLEYGQDLIAHTAKYLGPKGSVTALSNGMNCQNCHLDAGTKVFGNNYGSVAATYPKVRARSGKEETIEMRINDCFQRSLNGKPLENDSKEMQAIVAYINFLGKDAPKGKKVEGGGFKKMAFLDRAIHPENGKKVYMEKCQSCHQADGQGQLAADGIEYSFPPLWGPNSYNVSAGLYRMSNFARYVKYNMPLGASHDSPQLTDEEAWDVAAFVNTQPRPEKRFPKDWPDISKKPIDHPFGPFADDFSEEQHKFGPFKPIEAHYAQLSSTNKK